MRKRTGYPHYHLLSIPGYSRRPGHNAGCDSPHPVTQYKSAASFALHRSIAFSPEVSLQDIPYMTIYTLRALQDVRDQRIARLDIPTEAPIDAPHPTSDALACWNGQRFVSWNEWLFSRGFTDSTDCDSKQIKFPSVDQVEKNNSPRPNLREFGNQTVLF